MKYKYCVCERFSLKDKRFCFESAVAKTSLWLDQNIGLHKHNLCITHSISYNGCVMLNWEVHISHSAYYCIWYVANSLRSACGKEYLTNFYFRHWWHMYYSHAHILKMSSQVNFCLSTQWLITGN